jgi:hypothetical protein
MKTVLLIFALISFLSLNSFACPGNPNCPMHKGEMTKEKRAEMAGVHTQMADCLNSEKPMEDCHKIMAEHMGGPMHDKMGGQSCAQGDGKNNCPMHKETKKSNSKK